MNKHFAVFVKSVDKSYGENKILDNFSMNVERGTIFALLGASGCGKTTLLSCLLGRKGTDGGEVCVLSKTPGVKGSGVPGPRVGYMPQEMALVPEHTVRDSIFYFGRIANMEDRDIEIKLEELTILLDLPERHRYLKDCSGGEQRRVSLAAAIVHSPELLILDEPTVGVDPVLREKIWDYLFNLVEKEDMSVIMTTHYIEEAKLANKVGFMRNGKLLAQSSPEDILQIFHCQTLEEAFLKLCVEQEKEHLSTFEANCMKSMENLKYILGKTHPSASSSLQSFDMDCGSTKKLSKMSNIKRHSKMKTFLGLNTKRIYALMDKNWKQFYRNFSGVIMFTVIPIVQTMCLLYGVGGDMKHLKLGIVNHETSVSSCQNYDRNSTAIAVTDTYECHFRNLSCRFLEYLEHPMIEKVFYNSLEEGYESTQHGKGTGVLYIGKNFTESYQERVRNVVSLDDSVVDFSEIKVFLDMSDREVGYSLKYKLIELFLDFQDDLFRDCGWDKRLGHVPINEEYLYGKKDDAFIVFMIPGLIVTSGFFFGSMMTSQIIISEKCEGVWDRSLASGVTSLEITLTHLVLQSFLAFIQSVEPLVVVFFIYGMDYLGNFWYMLILSCLQGICGLTFGFLVSIVSESFTQAHIITTGFMFPSLVLCGLMWPVEGMPYFLQIISKCLPYTLAIDSFRNMFRKGWPIYNLQVIGGVLTNLAWICIFIIVSLWQLKKQK